MRPVIDQRVERDKNGVWCCDDGPSSHGSVGRDEHGKPLRIFYFTTSTPWTIEKLQPGMQALKRKCSETDQVEIKGPGTDLRFHREFGRLRGDRNMEWRSLASGKKNGVEGSCHVHCSEHLWSSVVAAFRNGR